MCHESVPRIDGDDAGASRSESDMLFAGQWVERTKALQEGTNVCREWRRERLDMQKTRKEQYRSLYLSIIIRSGPWVWMHLVQRSTESRVSAHGKHSTPRVGVTVIWEESEVKAKTARRFPNFPEIDVENWWTYLTKSKQGSDSFPVTPTPSPAACKIARWEHACY